ncbi:MAG: hypothetical protein ACI959_000415 [Limisphaerales bacterium]|jgi:hypothetical protein
MKKWWLKLIIQKFISLLPVKHRINLLFQRHITRGAILTQDYYEDKITHFRTHRKLWDEKHDNPAPKVLELGTGWFPVIPIAFWLTGVKQVMTIDLSRLCRAVDAQDTVKLFLQLADSGKLNLGGDYNLARIEELRAVVNSPDPMAELGIKYIIGDAAQLPDADGSIDLIVSNNVLEHVSESALNSIFKKFGKLISPNGLSSHFVDMSDHFAHLDKSITVFHFLRYSPSTWNIIDNSIQPQNRLRAPFFRNLFINTGHQIEEELVISKNEALIKQEPVHPSFGNEDLGLYHVHWALAK